MVMDRPPFVLELTTKNFVRVVAFALSLFFFFGVNECPRSFLSSFSFLSIFPVVPFGFYLQKDSRIFRVTLMFDGICEVVAEMQLL